MITVRCALGLAMLLVGCGTTPLPVGAACQQTADCAGDLVCHELGQFTGTTCTVPGKACTTLCVDDTTCAPLGASFKCFATCGTDKVCVQTASP